MDFILPHVGIRTQDPNFCIFGALKTRGSMMRTPGIFVCIISIKVCLNYIMCVRKRTVLGNVNFQELTVNLRKWVRKRTCVGKQQLFTHCKFKEEFIKLKQVP